MRSHGTLVYHPQVVNRHEDAGRVLNVAAERDKGPDTDIVADVEVTLFDRGIWLQAERNSASDRVVFPTPTAINKAELVEHVKQEGHKADDTKVPNRRWSFFFR